MLFPIPLATFVMRTKSSDLNFVTMVLTTLTLKISESVCTVMCEWDEDIKTVSKDINMVYYKVKIIKILDNVGLGVENMNSDTFGQYSSECY